MKFYFLTLFPKIIETYFQEAIFYRAVENGVVSCETVDIREFGEGPHRRVDGYPYGGGAGMVMMVEPLARALQSIPGYEDIPVIYLSPGGPTFTQARSRELAGHEALIFICGRYEGVDQRFIDRYVDLEISVGDYVLTGGELPALTIADAVARHLDNFLGNSESLDQESFEESLLEYPQYTRPPVYEGQEVPAILTSGNHGAVDAWRREQAVAKTRERRPDLYEKYLKNNKK